jgi:hypothetical protein
MSCLSPDCTGSQIQSQRWQAHASMSVARMSNASTDRQTENSYLNCSSSRYTSTLAASAMNLASLQRPSTPSQILRSSASFLQAGGSLAS